MSAARAASSRSSRFPSSEATEAQIQDDVRGESDEPNGLQKAEAIRGERQQDTDDDQTDGVGRGCSQAWGARPDVHPRTSRLRSSSSATRPTAKGIM